MNPLNLIPPRWRKLSITTKFRAIFGLVLALILLLALTSYISLRLLQRQTEASIVTSTEIQALVLEMDRDLQEARVLHRDFFLRYPAEGLSAAREVYALEAVKKLSHVVSLSADLKQRLMGTEVSTALEQHQVDVNLYLSAAERFADTFLESVELVTQLAADETGLEARLAENSNRLRAVLRTADDTSLTEWYNNMRAYEEDYLRSRQRSQMQSALNAAFQLRETIKKTDSLTAAAKVQALTYLDSYEVLTQDIIELDTAIRSKLNDFDLQAQAVDPISAQLIASATREVEQARTRITQANQLATSLLIGTAAAGLVLATLAVRLLNNSVTGNVVKLTEAVRQWQAGDLGTLVQIDSADELDTLAQAFNTMTSQLYNLIGNLELEIAERTRAEEEVQRRNRELTLLNRVIAASVTTNEAEAILSITCRELAVAFNLPQAAAVLLNKEKTKATVVAEYSAEGQPSILGQVLPVTEFPVAQYILSYKTPLVVDEAQTNPRLAGVRHLMAQRRTTSLLIVPLVVDKEVIGTIGLDAIEPHQFTIEEINLAWSVANQVAGVLARLRLDKQRQQLQAQYYQSQKMEAIGQLTGGVAHDFNNILTVIMGYTDLLLVRLSKEGDSLRTEVEGIKRAAQQAAALTRQLLVFSRQQIMQPKVLSINHIITSLNQMLQRLISKNIELVLRLADELGHVKADPSQMEQVVMNLVINARDAMPEGGKLIIETANIYLNEEYASKHIGVKPGSYVMLAVSDTGLGMDAETRSRIFEPFFTTKESGKGTGLGLATVHGIVSQSGGHVWVDSEPGQGTTFKVYLPQSETNGEQEQSKLAPVKTGQGWETILLVEDEETVRDLAHRVLFNQGYAVLEARDSEEARQKCAAYNDPIHLLLTDMVIPGGVTGIQLAEDLVSLHPEMKVLYISGYTDNAIIPNGTLDPSGAFLPKPFSSNELVCKVHELLALGKHPAEQGGPGPARSSGAAGGQNC